MLVEAEIEAAIWTGSVRAAVKPTPDALASAFTPFTQRPV